MMRRFSAMLVASCFLIAVSPAGAREPGWRGQIIARGEFRAQVESMPIQARPYRPLHFYGNTVRRRHYRGRARPTLHDLTAGLAAFAVRR